MTSQPVPLRARMGLGLAPLCLRLALGLTFLWLGLGKLVVNDPVKGQDAAVLANLGVLPLAPPGEGRAPARVPVAGPGAVYEAQDFPDEMQARRLYTAITLPLIHAAEPSAAAPTRLWPGFAANGQWPVALAWVVVCVQLIGGAFVLGGLFVRFWGLLMLLVMLGALWLMHIGPAVQSGRTLLGFLPRHEVFDVNAWMRFAWFFGLAMMALALFLAGPGALALDNLLFRERRPTPRPSAPKP